MRFFAVFLWVLAIALPAHQVSAQDAPAAAARDYTVNAGDDIEVYVWGEERLQRSYRVLPDGSFSFPLIGRIVAVGKTLPAIEALVTKGLESQYRGQVPQVTVSIKAPTGLQFSVAGKVRSPGTFTPSRYVNVLDAVTLAGGPGEFANLDNVVIYRKSGAGLVAIRARLGAIFKGSASASGLAASAIPAIESGDTVIVP